MKFSIREITLIGVFAALTAVLSQVSIRLPISPVPVTLQLFAIFVTAVLLGSRCGALSQIVYLIIGAVGAPVFANFEGGFQVISGPKGGYLISFPIIAFVIGKILEGRKTPSRMDMVGAMVVGLIICYSLGATWLGISLKWDASKALMSGVAMFLPFDIIKIVVAAFLGYQVRESLIKANLIM